MIKCEKVRFTFRLPKKLFEKIKDTANHEGISVNAFILQILWDWVEKQKNKTN